MNVQASLFDRPQQSVDVARMERLVLDAIEQSGERGATADEIAERLGLPNTSTRPRCTGLSRRGVIYDSGVRRACGIHQRGIVWKIAG